MDKDKDVDTLYKRIGAKTKTKTKTKTNDKDKDKDVNIMLKRIVTCLP